MGTKGSGPKTDKEEKKTDQKLTGKDDIGDNFEEQRKKAEEKIGDAQMPADAKSRIITVVVLAVILITMWFLLDIAIGTFILTFVFYHLQKYALKGLSKTPFKIIPAGVVLALIYVGVIALVVFFAVQNIPVILRQLGDIGVTFMRFDFEKFTAELDPNLAPFVSLIDINEYIWRAGQAIISGLASVGQLAFNFIISLILSFLFVLEKKKITMIGNSMLNSRVAHVYRYFVVFAGSFVYTFGKVMKVQVFIAVINCAIMTIYLSLSNFQYLMVLSIMVFILGLIPIAGVFISMVPLAIIGFSFGGLQQCIEVLVVTVVIHVIETYFLNPRLMSRRMSLPVSLVFVVLIVSQRYLGVWGMLIGVPLFIYALNVLNIDYRRAMENEFLWKPGKSEKPGRADKGKSEKPDKEGKGDSKELFNHRKKE